MEAVWESLLEELKENGLVVTCCVCKHKLKLSVNWLDVPEWFCLSVEKLCKVSHSYCTQCAVIMKEQMKRDYEDMKKDGLIRGKEDDK